jgi:hypothetical protein
MSYEGESSPLRVPNYYLTLLSYAPLGFERGRMEENEEAEDTR